MISEINNNFINDEQILTSCFASWSAPDSASLSLELLASAVCGGSDCHSLIWGLGRLWRERGGGEGRETERQREGRGERQREREREGKGERQREREGRGERQREGMGERGGDGGSE